MRTYSRSSSCRTFVVPPCTFKQSNKDVRRRADVLRSPPRQNERLSASQSRRAVLSRVVQAGRQAVKLSQVDVGEPEQRPVTGCQVVGDAVVLS